MGYSFLGVSDKEIKFREVADHGPVLVSDGYLIGRKRVREALNLRCFPPESLTPHVAAGSETSRGFGGNRKTQFDDQKSQVLRG